MAEPDQTGAAVYGGVHAHRDADGWVLHGTASQVLDGDRADLLAVVTDAGVFVVTADKVTATRSPVFDPALHIADVRFEQVRVEGDPRSDVDSVRGRHMALTGLALTLSVRANVFSISRSTM